MKDEAKLGSWCLEVGAFHYLVKDLKKTAHFRGQGNVLLRLRVKFVIANYTAHFFGFL